MPYRYPAELDDYSDYASGRVFYSAAGRPAFPVRLAGEMFRRCLEQRAALGLSGPVTLYDPLCGGAYHLATLAYLYWPHIAQIIASDIDEDALVIARRNLALLTMAGLRARAAEIEAMLAAYGKTSHAQALASVQRLETRLAQLAAARPIPTGVFRADVADAAALVQGLATALDGRRVDVILTDLPYGRRTMWLGSAGASYPAADAGMPAAAGALEALLSVVGPETVVAVAADKAQKIVHPTYRAVERFGIGKRQITLLKATRL